MPSVFGELECSQSQNATGTGISPSGSGKTHSLFDQCFAGRFGDTTANGEIVFFLIGVTHSVLIIPVIGDHHANFFITFNPVSFIEMGSLRFQFFDESTGGALFMF